MGYRPTGRASGRPRGPASADGKLRQARKNLPEAEAFQELWRAIDRVMHVPDKVIVKAYNKDKRKVTVYHRYTSAERGQVLAFAWWVYMNRTSWDRKARHAAVTILSPLMLFPSTFLADMAALPQSTAHRYMVRPPGLEISKVTGSCDVWVVYQLIEAAALDLTEFRHRIREISLTMNVPAALLSRLSGVPVEILLRPEHGIQFFPERPDYETGMICTSDQCDLYWKYHKEERRNYDPQPGDQFATRHAIAGSPMGEIRTTTAPVSGHGELPYHFAIPGLPPLSDSVSDPQRFFRMVRDWEFTYHLSAAAYVRNRAEGERS